jgi:ribosomal protein L37AE/L43A
MQNDKHEEQISTPLHRSSQEERAAKRTEAGIVRCECCGAVIPGYRFNVQFEDGESLSCIVCGYSNRYLRALKSASA